MGLGPGDHAGMRPAGEERPGADHLWPQRHPVPAAGASRWYPLATEPQGSVFGDLQWAHSAWSCLSVSCTCLRGQEPSSETGAAQPGPEPALVSSSSSQRVTLKVSLGTRTWDRGLLPAMASSLTPSSCALEAPGRCASNSLEAMMGLYAVGVQQTERNWGWAYVDPREQAGQMAQGPWSGMGTRSEVLPPFSQPWAVT